MDAESSKEHTMRLVRQHLEVASLEKKQTLIKEQEDHLFPHPSWLWKYSKWTTRQDITYVTTLEEDHISNNIKLAMIKEMLGLGPQSYCIIDDETPGFEKRVLLLLYYLPHSKLCIYPPNHSIGPTFLRSPWREIRKAIIDNVVPYDINLARSTDHAQQFELWMESGGATPYPHFWDYQDFEL